MALRIVFSVGATASVVVDTAVTVGVHAAALAAAVPAATLRVIMEEEVRTPLCAHREPAASRASPVAWRAGLGPEKDNPVEVLVGEFS